MFRKIVGSVLLNALLSCTAFAQVVSPPRVEVQEEGASQGRVRTLNCAGASLTCTVSGSTGTLTISGGAASNVVEVSFTVTDDVVGLIYTTTVTGQSWVTSTSKIICSPFADGSGSTPIELAFASGQMATVSNRVVSTGFDLTLFNPYGAAGTFKFHCTGA